MRKWGLSVQMLPGEAEVPTPGRKRGLTEPGWGCGSGSRAGPGMMGEEKPSKGGPRPGEGGTSILGEKGGPWLGGFYCKALFTPRAE